MKTHIMLAALAAALVLGLQSAPAWSQVDCALATDQDADGDGFTDLQECLGITLLDGSVFPGAASPDGTQLPRTGRLDPNSKDLFVIYRRAAGTLLGNLPNPFEPVTFHNIAFRGLSALGLTVHVLNDENNVFGSRAVSAESSQKAVRISESLDTSGTILGNCQWGTPLGLDGCIVYTQRTRNFIDSTCPADPADVRDQVFHAYATFLILHETGHSLGGLAAEYNSRFGGYHYKAGSDIVMEQAATYSVKRNTCTWYISSDWNTTLDAPAVRLK